MSINYLITYSKIELFESSWALAEMLRIKLSLSWKLIPRKLIFSSISSDTSLDINTYIHVWLSISDDYEKVFDNSKFCLKFQTFSIFSLLQQELFYTNVLINFHPKLYLNYTYSSKIKMTNSCCFCPYVKKIILKALHILQHVATQS